MKTTLTIGLLLGSLAAISVLAQGPMRPGRWETTMQMEMANMPMQMPEMKHAQCITAEQLQKDPSTGLPSGMANQAQNSCKVSDYKESGSTISWNVACTAPQAMNGSGELTFKGDTYTGLIKMTSAMGAMTMKVNGTRVGDCTQ